MSTQHNLEFESHGTLTLDNLPEVHSWLIRALDELQIDSSDLLFIICTDEELLKINQDSLNHDYYTDIITCDLLDEYSTTSLEADLYISLDRVRENADNLEESFEKEYKRVLIHGILHLVGYADKDPQSEQEMRVLENKLINI